MKTPWHKFLIGGFVSAAIALGNVSASFAGSPQPFLGLQIQGISPMIAQALGLEAETGVMVRDIAFPGPTSRSDMQRGDIILRLGNEEVANVDQLVKMAGALKPGEKVDVVVLRRNKEISFEMTLGARPPEWNITRNSFATLPSWGVTLASLTPKVYERFALGWNTKGVAVTLLDREKSSNLDLRVGDVIVQVNQRQVWEPSHVLSYLDKAKKEQKEFAILLVEGIDGFRFVPMPLK